MSAQAVADASNDGNTGNDRLPEFSRNPFTRPNYAIADSRVGRTLKPAKSMRMEWMAEAFNVVNRDNQRVEITHDGVGNLAADLRQQATVIEAKHDPAQQIARRMHGSDQLVRAATGAICAAV